ncbi:hypothetical protein Fcan01_10514 [Folsomia candida]|uniref:Uncharacterized protein n=1 Tax=Folsomia candida TaxID=158441 RepID=A0A226EBN2_FOLCA|nr:hypothetical protein Fcan01_10514 [Folsomia candida]
MASDLSQPADGVLEEKFNTDCNFGSYTFGEKYVSWKTQGEFIFFQSKRPHWNWSFAMEILCGRDSYWIKPARGNIIFKNGVKFDTDAKIQLNFGDELSFTKHRNNVSGGLAVFTFKRREYPSNWDKWNKSKHDSGFGCDRCGSEILDFTLHKNKLVFSHLSIGSLKNARLVCKDWNEQAPPILRAKSVVNFALHSNYLTPSLIFLRYVHEMKNATPWPNWKISYPEISAEGRDERKWGVKYIEDFTWFLRSQRGHHVKSLSLCGTISSDLDYGTYLKPVLQLKDTLEELRLDFTMKIFDDDGNEKKYAITGLGSIYLKSLKKFSIELRFDDKPIPLPQFEAPWMKIWAKAINRVDSIVTLGDASFMSRFIQELQSSMGTWSYQRLTEVMLTCKGSDGIKFLTEVNQPLKKMTFTVPLENGNLPDFENLLKKHAPSLELLSFRISTDGMEGKSSFVVNFPGFPKLKELDVNFGTYDDYDDEYCFIENEARLSLAFPCGEDDPDDNSINYEVHLPSICAIVLSPEFNDDAGDFWNTYGGFVDSLLPKEEGQLCKTLQSLEMPTCAENAIETGYLRAARLPEENSKNGKPPVGNISLVPRNRFENLGIGLST